MIIVTGGLGFIGNELVRQLIKSKQEVIIIDNKNRVAPDIDDISQVRVVDLDVTNFEGVSDLFRSVQPSTVFHLAAIHFIPECNENPERTLRINVEGTQSMLRASVENGVKNFLFASSGAVYADQEAPLREDAPIAPADIYGQSKLFGEYLCKRFASQSNLKIAICRLFNNYGLRETNLHIIPEIIDQMKKGYVLKLGNIKPIRDYIHTKDCAKAFIRLNEVLKSNMEIVNFATGIGCSVEQIIEKIEKLIEKKITVELDGNRLRKIDKMVQVGANNKLNALTGWKPEEKIEKGLRELLINDGLI